MALYLVVRSTSNAKSKPAANELAFLGQAREERAEISREVEKVVEVIVALPVLAGPAVDSNRLSRQELTPSLHAFLATKLRLEWNTQTKMVHVVVSPKKITVFARLQPTKPQIAIREFIRMEETTWAVSTRQSSDLQAAIRQAELESAAAAVKES